ncbi:hypothetical protein RJ641_000442 [Dillenia turbinata]|uniref:Uncharacterized protein n=1 Tax=Dillenia turbinata TaxID=194707 RepID=A0AAN8WBY3_9MAGN
MGIVIALEKIYDKKPERRYKWEPIKDDLEFGNSIYPVVQIQIPIYNGKEERKIKDLVRASRTTTTSPRLSLLPVFG